MTDEELLSRTHRAFTQVFGEQLAFDQGLERIAEPRWTSLKHVELMIALEREFQVRFDGADAVDMTTVQAVLNRIRARLV